jgi:hypothetical protein
VKYSPDFYLFFAIMLIPTTGFCYATIHKKSRPWVVKAIEDSDERPNHVDLTFLATFIVGWMISIAMEYAMGLYLIEDKNTLGFCGQCLGAICLLWGVNKYLALKESHKTH